MTLILALTITGILSLAFASDVARSSASSPECVRPPDGFLIIASKLGWNDSMSNGAPAKPWPVIRVSEGELVNITVCNADIQTHSFQVTGYLEDTINILKPGQVRHFMFITNQTGTFTIYDDVLSSLEAYMQSGQLIVT